MVPCSICFYVDNTLHLGNQQSVFLWMFLLDSRTTCLTAVTPWIVACQPPVHGILQARILKWVAISFSKTLYLVLIKKKSTSLLLLFIARLDSQIQKVSWIQVFFLRKRIVCLSLITLFLFVFFFLIICLFIQIYKKPKFYWTWLKQDF